MCFHLRQSIKNSNVRGSSVQVKVQTVDNNLLELTPDVHKKKQQVDRLCIRKMCNRMDTAKQGTAVGSFDKINRCLRDHITPNNFNQERDGEPFILYMHMGMQSSMQVVVATRKSLANFTSFGLRHAISDSRWGGPTGDKICHTTLVVQNENSHYPPVGASFSSCETAETAATFIKALHACRPCGPDCSHQLKLVPNADILTLQWARECCDERGNILNKQTVPLVSIDKDTGAAKAFVKSCIDPFHHKRAFNESLKKYGVPRGMVSAAINHLHNVVLRYDSDFSSSFVIVR
jgi:hypothetical protein